MKIDLSGGTTNVLQSVIDQFLFLTVAPDANSQHNLRVDSHYWMHTGNYTVTVKSTLQDTWGAVNEASYSFGLEMKHWCNLVTITPIEIEASEYYI